MISTFSKIFSKSRGKSPTVPRTPIPTHPLGIIQRIPVHRTGDMDGQRVSEPGYYIMVERRQATAFTHTMTTARSVLWRWKMTLIRLAVEVQGVHTEKAFVACRFVNCKVTNDGPRRPSSRACFKKNSSLHISQKNFSTTFFRILPKNFLNFSSQKFFFFFSHSPFSLSS